MNVTKNRVVLLHLLTDHPHHACIRRAAFVRPRRIAECAESWLSHNVSSQATGQLMHLLLLT